MTPILVFMEWTFSPSWQEKEKESLEENIKDQELAISKKSREKMPKIGSKKNFLELLYK